MPEITAPSTANPPFWFESFLLRLRQDLGYPLNLDKYRQLASWANTHYWSSPGRPYEPLYKVCKLLFLQKWEDEARFEYLFFEHLVDELAFEQPLLRQEAAKSAETNIAGGTQADEQSDAGKPVETSGAGAGEEENKAQALLPEPPDGPSPDARRIDMKYLNIGVDMQQVPADNSAISAAGSRFLLSDAYLPITERDMIHGWRYLRRREKKRNGVEMDIPSTVKAVAADGFFSQPVFLPEYENAEDLLLLLIDRTGSMVPFHWLSDQLVAKAVKDGGHRKARVFYFYNAPGKYVYKDPGLTEQVDVKALLAGLKPGKTNAIIISDAGAARGRYLEGRVMKTAAFLLGNQEHEGLIKRSRNTVWFNPMPEVRWRNTSAATIHYSPLMPTMYSLLDIGYEGFARIIVKIMSNK